MAGDDNKDASAIAGGSGKDSKGPSDGPSERASEYGSQHPLEHATEPAPAYEAQQAHDAKNPRGPAHPSAPAGPAGLGDPAGPGIMASTQSVPTVNSPFDFPSNAALPPYSPPSLSSGQKAQKPIAIPQSQPDAASSFLPAYPPCLLSHGITNETWRSFEETMSAFLTAKVSDRAVSHAADMARHMGDAPKSFGKGVVAHAKSVGKNISSNAKRGNILGAAVGVVGGIISLPVATAMGAAGTALQLPASAVGAIAKKPQTPRERATAYAAVANKKWLHARGLDAQLVDSQGLARLLGLPAGTLLELARGADGKEGGSDRPAMDQLRGLEEHVASLETRDNPVLHLGQNTLWLVLIPAERS